MEIRRFYNRLLATLRSPTVRDDEWRLLEGLPTRDGNWSDVRFVACIWERELSEGRIVAVNYPPHHSQCRLPLSRRDLGASVGCLKDQLGADIYDWNGSELEANGLFLDMKPWQAAAYFYSVNPEGGNISIRERQHHVKTAS